MVLVCSLLNAHFLVVTHAFVGSVWALSCEFANRYCLNLCTILSVYTGIVCNMIAYKYTGVCADSVLCIIIGYFECVPGRWGVVGVCAHLSGCIHPQTCLIS